MIPVDQDKFGFPGDNPDGTVGNCFAACVASLLEIPLADVPQFFNGDPDHDEGWFSRFNDWLRERGYCALYSRDENTVPPCLHIAGGQSPRKPGDPSKLHAVVARGQEIVHDPHPAREGLLTRDDAIILVPLDPAPPAPPITLAVCAGRDDVPCNLRATHRLRSGALEVLHCEAHAHPAARLITERA